MKKILTLVLTCVLAFSLAGCGGSKDSSTAGSGDLSGKISLDGSTSMEKFVTALGESFKEKNPNVTVEAQFTGSSAGISSVLNGKADIGDSSRALTDEEKSQGLEENIVAIDGIAVAVNKNNTVKNVTKEQLTKIYTGEITNWKELGGKDEKIVVIGREAASGTRGAFEELLEVKDKCQYAQELDNTGAVVAKCASIEGAIGYVSLDAVDKSINTLQLDGVDCTVKNIKAGKYALQRPFVMATKGKIEKQSKLVQALFDYIDSDEGQAIIKKVGLISANSIVGTNKSRQASEKAAALIVSVCAAFSIVAVVAITAYMIYSGTPALAKVGIGNILLKTEWVPSQGKFGILYIILTSIVGTLLAVLIAIPVGLFTAAALSEMVTGTPKKIMKAAIELLAGIPSVVYGLLGILIINPQMYKLEKFFYHTSHSHQFTGGANLIAAIIVLVIMILPTLINVSETALETVPNHLRLSSYALGATKIQTIFKVVIPAAKNGIMSAIVLGVGRAIGEAMAILLVAGNAVNLPAPFNSVRFLTTAIVSEMSYSSGVHRQVLFTIGLVLFIFIMIINIVLMKILKKGEENG